jgi:hypothetical protein
LAKGKGKTAQGCSTKHVMHGAGNSIRDKAELKTHMIAVKQEGFTARMELIIFVEPEI